MSDNSGADWIGYRSDRHGRPAEEGNDHLTSKQREKLQRRGDARAQARGRHQAGVVVDVYENGEAVPQMQFPQESSIDRADPAEVSACVARAAETLRNWK